ncbi:tRNA (adenosine(37)-N6)-threonylcarbamoyltransferase complex ATPase subunit type 1 TsaE [Patescibacteria group bacterium]|nr:MAG: tRNA (adenosine(37)-N6)-threonylcarbamoyltransferase complex ATPase subunit type 1 TsaE [Patescibacteria group bacterium]
MEFISHSVLETASFAKDFLEKLADRGKASSATVVGLYGNLGAGKTTFTQCLAKELGIMETITSPTFVIEKIYPLKHSPSTVFPQGCSTTSPQSSPQFKLPFTQLIHIDAYRLEKGAELAVLGFEKLLNDPKNLILIEWPERVADIMPKDHFRLKFEFVDENTRIMELEN